MSCLGLPFFLLGLSTYKSISSFKRSFVFSSVNIALNSSIAFWITNLIFDDWFTWNERVLIPSPNMRFNVIGIFPMLCCSIWVLSSLWNAFDEFSKAWLNLLIFFRLFLKVGTLRGRFSNGGVLDSVARQQYSVWRT